MGHKTQLLMLQFTLPLTLVVADLTVPSLVLLRPLVALPRTTMPHQDTDSHHLPRISPHIRSTRFMRELRCDSSLLRYQAPTRESTEKAA